MDIRKMFLASRTIMAFAMTVAFVFPCVVEAVSIGKVVLQSRTGEPLSARVDLIVGSDESKVDDSCLSLVAPGSDEKDAGGYLTSASLSLKTEGKRQYVAISSLTPFDNAFPRLRLQIKCPGTESVTKTLILLEKRPTSSAQMGSKEANRSASSSIDASGKPIDGSRIVKLSPEERATLLAQIKQWQDELESIKQQLAQLNVKPSIAASSITVLSAAPISSVTVPPVVPLATTGTQESNPKPVLTVKPLEVQQNNLDLPNGLLVALGVLLLILILWLGLRYYTKIKSRIRISSQQEATPILKVSDDAAAAPKIVISSAAKPSQVPPFQVKVAPAPADVAPPKASPVKNDAVDPILSSHQEIEEEVTEEDSMLEEAELYATHGRPAKAVEILLDITKRRPAKASAWSLLLSIYSSLGKAAEFEKTAREFLNHHKDSPAWSGIQALGRTFDKNNPLYADNNSHISASPLLNDAESSRRPVGDILMEMGILSKRELQKYLDDFDPKKHGRFGGYLLARKAITLAQLDQVLLQQQGVGNEVKADALPSLQDMENFLADFDPKLHGSVGEFLASRNAATPEQLSQLLKQK